MRRFILFLISIAMLFSCTACGDGNGGSEQVESPCLMAYRFDILDDGGNNVSEFTQIDCLKKSECMTTTTYSMVLGYYVGAVIKADDIEYTPFVDIEFEYDDRYVTIEPDINNGSGRYILITKNTVGKTLISVHTVSDYFGDLDCILTIKE